MSEPALKKQKAEDGTAVNTVTADDATAASAATSSAALSSSTHAVSSSPPTVSASSSSSKRAIGMNDDALGLQLIKQGAEGRVYSCNFFGRPAIMKERFSKQYRHPSLDQKLTQARMNQEVRCMIKAKKLPQARTAPRPDTIWTPTIYLVDEDAQRIYMERIDGKTVKDTMYTLDLTAPEHKEQALELAVRIGRGIADLHHAGSE